MTERDVELFLRWIKYPADPFLKQEQKIRACQRGWISYDFKFAQRSFRQRTGHCQTRQYAVGLSLVSDTLTGERQDVEVC